MLADFRTVPEPHRPIPRLRIVVRLACALFAVAWVAAADTRPSVQTADAHRYLDDVKALTIPTMEGRGDGSKGLSRAAKLIEQRYKSLGLRPAGKIGYFQPFSVI